ncbi:MAG: GGDEF domain-containing protein [Deltaproteobacteria bacterium]|nr:GGDEF domain-containing protein [Deltaproteobacteria bacterium]
MVEVNTPGPASEDSPLRQRVWRLSAELDKMETRYGELFEVLRSAVTALSGMVSGDYTRNTEKALKKLKKAIAVTPPKIEPVVQAVEVLRQALQSEPSSGQGGAVDTVTEMQEVPQDWRARSEAGRHVVLALLMGLRLGDEKFDAALDSAVERLQWDIDEGAVRPAMVTVADLMDLFHATLQRERRDTEKAFREVMTEVLKTEVEMTDAFGALNDQLVTEGKEHSRHLAESLALMLEEVNRAGDLPALRNQALGHIRQLRDTLKARRAAEENYRNRVQAVLVRAKEMLLRGKLAVAEQDRAAEKRARQALNCPLTALPNKRALGLELAARLEDASAQPLSLLVFDIDHFRRINDEYGPQAGDRALKAIAMFTCKALRETDTLYRYAGDEFVAILPRTPMMEAVTMAEKVRQAAEKIRFTYEGEGEIRLTISMGAALAFTGDTPGRLFDRADQALMQAKEAGRNRVHAAAATPPAA